MFGGLGLIVGALLILPILGGIAVGLFLLSVPRMRFLSPYCALVPLFSISGLIVGLWEGYESPNLIFTATTTGVRQPSGLLGR